MQCWGTSWRGFRTTVLKDQNCTILSDWIGYLACYGNVSLVNSVFPILAWLNIAARGCKPNGSQMNFFKLDIALKSVTVWNCTTVIYYVFRFMLGVLLYTGNQECKHEHCNEGPECSVLLERARANLNVWEQLGNSGKPNVMSVFYKVNYISNYASQK